jgi:hypothetical protein
VAQEVEAVLRVEERHAAATRLLEGVAVDAADPAQRKPTFDGKVPSGETHQGPCGDRLARGERQVSTGVQDVPVVVAIPAEAMAGDLRRPVDACAEGLPARRAVQIVEQVLREGPPGPRLRHPARIPRICQHERPHLA